jgi:hypothetical protein
LSNRGRSTLTRRRTLSWTSCLSSKLGELALQHRGTQAGSSSSAQHPKPNAAVSANGGVESSSSSDPPGPFWVMTSNRAGHELRELIQLPTIIKVRLLGTRRQSGTGPGTVPDLAGDGDAPPSPSPIRPESGTLPRPRPRFGGDGDRDAPPSPIPIGGSAPWNCDLRRHPERPQ